MAKNDHMAELLHNQKVLNTSGEYIVGCRGVDSNTNVCNSKTSDQVK